MSKFFNSEFKSKIITSKVNSTGQPYDVIEKEFNTLAGMLDVLNFKFELMSNIFAGDFKIDDKSATSTMLFQIIPVIKKSLVHFSLNDAFDMSLFGLKSAMKFNQEVDFSSLFSDVKIVGGGLIVFETSNGFYEALAKHMATIKNEDKKMDKSIVVDYSSPNIAKEMHIGHLRSTVLGDALANIYSYLGYDVHRVNHIGDYGTQFGMIMALIKSKNIDLSKVKDIGDIYLEAKIMFDKSDDFKELSKKLILNLQNGGEEEVAIWKSFREASINHIQDVYSQLNVNLTPDNIVGESFYVDMIEPMIKNLVKRGIAVVDDGATCIFLDGGTKNKNGDKTPFIIKKNDGAYLYATNDLAAINYRVDTIKPEEIVYVVDNRQKDHFSMLFEAYGKLKPNNEVKFSHVGFGTINSADGTPFRSRDGDVVKLLDVVDMVKAEAFKITKAKNPNWSDDEVEKISEPIAVSSMKYYDLMRNRNTNYNFNLDAMFDFNGNTAVYLLYVYARINAVFQKVGVDSDDFSVAGDIVISDKYESNLVSELYKFDSVLGSIAANKNVNLLCEYLFNLSKSFNSFYGNCKVYDGDIVNNARLALCKLTMDRMKAGLNILGIDCIDRI